LVAVMKKVYAGFEDYFSGGMLFIGLSLVMTNVVLRYFFGRPQSLLDEFSVYFVIWGTLCGISVALRNNHHIKVDMLFNLLPLPARRRVSVGAHLIGLAFAIFYTYYGYQLVANYLHSGQASSDSRFPLWIVNLVLPVSGIMFILRYLDKLYFHFKNRGRDWESAQGKGLHPDGDSPAF
jgi:C4-dicarboxylate transporter DctQ subunit